MSTIVAGKVRDLLVRYSSAREETVRERLVELHTGLVRGLARRFAHRGEPLEDLEQVGFLGLILAIERFDPARGTEFTSFAVPTILGEIRRHFRGNAWSVRVPRRLQETYLRAMRAEDELAQELGRMPSLAEIACRLCLDPDRVLAALEVSPARRAVSLDTPAGVTDREQGVALGERLGEPDGELARLEARMLLEQAMANLSPRERQVMTLRFVDQLSQREVAERLGVSPVQVLQLQRAALERARRDLGGAPSEGDDAAIRALTETIREDGVDPLRRAEALADLRTRLGCAPWEEVGRVVGLTRRHIHHLLNVTRRTIRPVVSSSPYDRCCGSRNRPSLHEYELSRLAAHRSRRGDLALSGFTLLVPRGHLICGSLSAPCERGCDVELPPPWQPAA
jgi:RNA polymerase sigma-B factor